jgi:RNA polymerase sigma-70 factor, ECF subfamily
MAQDSSFEELLANLRKRDNAAADRVFQRFQSQLIALASRHLDSRLFRKLDPEDVIQSVFQTLFNRLANGQFELGNWDTLWGLLTRITVRKCGKWTEYFHTRGRDIDREVSPSPGLSESDTGLEFIDRDPTPAEALTLAETVQELMRGLSEREQQVVSLSLQGVPPLEISERVGCSLSKVYRVLDHVRDRLKHMRDEGMQ